MERETRARLGILVCALLCALLLIGCRGWHWPLGPWPFPMIHNIWPNEDGTTWVYDYAWRVFYDYEMIRQYDTPEEVPPVPPLRVLAELMADHQIGGNINETEMVYRLWFDGMVTTQSGVTAQNLREDIYAEFARDTAGDGIGIDEAFLVRLAAARPDLWKKIADRLGSLGPRAIDMSSFAADAGAGGSYHPARLLQGDFEQALSKPMLLHGYAWEKTDQWIGTYGDLDQLLAYKFLDAMLRPGHEFTHQLVPSLADDVFLHCRILRRLDYESALGVYENALECLYAIDYGIATVDDVGGNTKYFRVFDYGTVVYAPNRGPIYCYERNLVQPGEQLSIGGGDKTLTIVEMVKRPQAELHQRE